MRIEYDPADSGLDKLALHLHRLGMRHILVVVGGGEVNDFTGVAQANRSKQLDFASFQRKDDVLGGTEHAAFTPRAGLAFGQVVDAQNHILRRHGQRQAVRRRKNVARAEHQHRRLNLRFGRKRDVHGHLVAVEVRVERGAHERVDADGLAFDKGRFERLNAKAVQRRSAVQQNRMLTNNVFQNVPDDGLLLLHHLLGLLDGGAMALGFELVIDEGLEELERHFLWQTALIELQLGTNHDDRAARVVHALAEQVLAETTLLALERVGQRFERAIIGAAQHPAAAAVVKQRVDRFLQHALFVAHNHVRGMQFHELLQPVVAVDDAAIEIVQIGSGKAPAVQRHEWAQLRRQDRDHVENHPLRLVAALAESFEHFQALGVLDALLERGIRLHFLAQFVGKLVDFHAAKQFLDGFRAHLGGELAGIFLLEFAILFFRQDFTLAKNRDFTGIDNHEGLKVQDALEVAHGNVQQVTDAAGQALEEPHMRAGRSQLDVAEALAADFAERHFDAALVANHSAVLHALVLTAQTFPVGDGPENLRAKQPVTLGLERAVVDGLRLGDFAVRP